MPHPFNNSLKATYGSISTTNTTIQLHLNSSTWCRLWNPGSEQQQGHDKVDRLKDKSVMELMSLLAEKGPTESCRAVSVNQEDPDPVSKRRKALWSFFKKPVAAAFQTSKEDKIKAELSTYCPLTLTLTLIQTHFSGGKCMKPTSQGSVIWRGNTYQSLQ